MKAFYLSILIIITAISSLLAQEKENEQIAFNRSMKLAKVISQAHIHDFSTDVHQFIDSLKNEGIDTLGVFYEKDNGTFTLNHCLDKNRIAVIHWKQNNQLYHKEVTNQCIDTIVMITQSSLISYYQEYQSQIDTAYILPSLPRIITDNKGNEFSSQCFICHDAAYIIYCQLGEHKKSVKYEYSDFYCNKGSILEYNETSIIKTWSDKIEEQIEDLKKE